MKKTNYEDILPMLSVDDLKEGETLLDRALSITKDPEKIRQLLGLKHVSDVLASLNAFAIRKEYHASLIKNGIEFDYLLRGIKDIADDPTEKGATRLKAFLSLLKSIGVDKFDVPSTGSGIGWEDELMKRYEEEKNQSIHEIQSIRELESGAEDAVDVKDNEIDIAIPMYDPAALYKVVTPKIPDKVLNQKKREDLISGSNT